MAKIRVFHVENALTLITKHFLNQDHKNCIAKIRVFHVENTLTLITKHFLNQDHTSISRRGFVSRGIWLRFSMTGL